MENLRRIRENLIKISRSLQRMFEIGNGKLSETMVDERKQKHRTPFPSLTLMSFATLHRKENENSDEKLFIFFLSLIFLL